MTLIRMYADLSLFPSVSPASYLQLFPRHPRCLLEHALEYSGEGGGMYPSANLPFLRTS